MATIINFAESVIASQVAVAMCPIIKAQLEMAREHDEQEAYKRAKEYAEADDKKMKKIYAGAKALWQKLTPAWAKAAIIAESREDKSDLQSDYWGSTSKKTVLLGFSKSARDSFKEMRRFAATFAPTQHLAGSSPNAEHREKYSMGAGYYLKNGHHHATGWEVRKLPFYGGNLPSDVVDFSLIEPPENGDCNVVKK